MTKIHIQVNDGSAIEPIHSTVEKLRQMDWQNLRILAKLGYSRAEITEIMVPRSMDYRTRKMYES